MLFSEVPEEIALKAHGEVRLQSGTNRFASQKGTTGFGAPRDVCREGVKVNILPSDLEVFGIALKSYFGFRLCQKKRSALQMVSCVFRPVRINMIRRLVKNALFYNLSIFRKE